MTRQRVSGRLVTRARLLIDAAQLGNQQAQRDLKIMMIKHREQMPEVLYELMWDSIHQSYPFLIDNEEITENTNAGT